MGSLDIDFSQSSIDKQSVGHRESRRESRRTNLEPNNVHAGPLAARQVGGNFNINTSSDPINVGREAIRKSKEVTSNNPGSQRFTDAKNEPNGASHRRISKAPTNQPPTGQSWTLPDHMKTPSHLSRGRANADDTPDVSRTHFQPLQTLTTSYNDFYCTRQLPLDQTFRTTKPRPSSLPLSTPQPTPSPKKKQDPNTPTTQKNFLNKPSAPPKKFIPYINLQKLSKKHLDRARQETSNRRSNFDDYQKIGGVKMNSKEPKYLDKTSEVNNWLPETTKNKLPYSITSQDFYGTKTERLVPGYSKVERFIRKSDKGWG